MLEEKCNAMCTLAHRSILLYYTSMDTRAKHGLECRYI